jgi:hypothetical protein
LKRLPPLLSVIAGLKLFTAHVTGNPVVIAALLMTGGPSS